MAITYDQMGNPLTNGIWTYTWEHGRQLASMAKSGTTWTYTYDANGMRTSRSNGTDTYTYVYNGDQLVQMTVGTHTLYFTYDAGGTPATVTLDGTMYYYITNLQGDVVAIWDETSNYICDYYYDAWGKVIIRSYSANHLIDDLNPLLYRGYVYDHDTNLYYLQSRYYNPEIGRFINADIYTSTGTGVLGNNMFAYCNNTPVNAFDPDGHVILYISIRDDPTLNMFFGCGGNGGGGGGGYAFAGFSSSKDKIDKWDPSYTESLGLAVGTSSHGHTTGGTASLVYDSSSDFALQLTQTIGESTCLLPGVSIGLCRTYSTANDVQHMAGASNSVGFTLCVGCGISFEFSWFETPSGKEYAVTIGFLLGAELEAHGSVSHTESTKSWNPFG